MNELDALDLAALAARALGEARCRRYLFDRPCSEEAPADVESAAASAAAKAPPANPRPPARGEGAERRG
jgi:hypothetical protein